MPMISRRAMLASLLASGTGFVRSSPCSPTSALSQAAVDPSLAALAPPDRPYSDYLDNTIPQTLDEIPVKQFEGERYEAQVPDTLDLAEMARETINCLTRLIAPKEYDYWVYHLLNMEVNPPVFEFGAAQWKNPFFAECIILMRAMCGSNENLQEDRKLIGPIVWNTGIDGLTYQNVRWGFQVLGTPYEGKPHADINNQGTQLRALAAWYQHSGNPLWKQLALKKIDHMLSLSVPDGDAFYFRMTRGYHPWYVERGKGRVLAMGDGEAVANRMIASSAGYTVQFLPRAASLWYVLTGHEPALELARGHAHYLMRTEGFYDPKTLSFPIIKHGHTTVFTYCMVSMATYGVATRDPEILKWVARGLDEYMAWRDPDKTGIVLARQMSEVGELLQVMLLLSRSGYGDYWETADRLIRNTIAPTLITHADIDRLKRQPVTMAGDPATTKTFYSADLKKAVPLNKPLPLGMAQPADAADRCRGGWFVTLERRSHSDSHSQGDDNGHLPLALYLAWDSIVENLGDTLKVNLLMNRASPWADIDSYLPYEGKVVIRMKTDKRCVLVRIPKWANWHRVACMIPTPSSAALPSAQPFHWSDRYFGYISIDNVHKGQTLIVTFPIARLEIEAAIPVSHSGDKVTQCRISLKGNTVIATSENINYPMGTHEKYRSDSIGKHTVTRFIYPKRIDGWCLTYYK